MDRDLFESLGDKHKSFEITEAGRKLLPGLPTVCRLDGRSFHTFTKGLIRPYDTRLREAMSETTKYLVNETKAVIGYTQSDEITLLFAGVDTDSEMPFGGKVQKLCSIYAALSSVKFNQQIQILIPEKSEYLPIFDARVYQYPNEYLAAECLVWREEDSIRNSITMAAHSVYSHKLLHKVGSKKKLELLEQAGINWDDYPRSFKRGVYVRRESILRNLTKEELENIPEKHRPTGPVRRSIINEVDLPPVRNIANLSDVVFRRDIPKVVDRDICPDCGYSWDQHEFAVPAPYCPA